jgi:hypothetical protein
MKAYIPIILTALLVAGCQNPPVASPTVVQPKPAPTVISRTVTSHPPAYRNKGRPAWTYDENRFHEDIQGEANLVEELREPDNYHFFLGAQTVFVGTEENARSGAQIDAINNFKAFLQTTGRNYLQERRGAGLGQKDIREFQTRMEAAATAESRQLKTVRWYFEEELTEWSDGRTEVKWRAWCLAAFSRERADGVYKSMLEADAIRVQQSPQSQQGGAMEDLKSAVELLRCTAVWEADGNYYRASIVRRGETSNVFSQLKDGQMRGVYRVNEALPYFGGLLSVESIQSGGVWITDGHTREFLRLTGTAIIER